MVRWAPLNVPLRRRLQTLVVLLLWPIQLWCFLLFLVLLLASAWTRYLMLAYLVWMFYDRSYTRGGWASAPFRWAEPLFLWNIFKEYFPIKLVKTAELDPKQAYIVGYHPHGILPLGCWVNFATNVNHVDEVFPGVKLRPLTLGVCFRIPFFREICLSSGLADPSKSTINVCLQRGDSVVIVVGGAQETLDCHPGTMTLTLKNRKGFVKMALRNGAHLVPCLAFGETDLFDQVSNPKGSKLRAFQDRMQKKLGFALPLMYGRGIFNYDFGWLPRRAAVTTVVGAPIEVPHVPEPSQAEIDKYHAAYVKALRALYDKHADKFAPHRHSSLKIQ